MSSGEKFVFGLLGVSISAGIINLLTSPWSEDVTTTLTNSSDDQQNDNKSNMKKKPYSFSI